LIKFIKKFVIKTPKGQNLIRTDRLFSILLLMNIPFPNKEQIGSLNREVRNKLKFNTFLAKNDFLKCNFWFDKGDENQINKLIKLSANNLMQFRRTSYLKSKRNSNASSLEDQLNEFNKDPFEKFTKQVFKKNPILRKTTVNNGEFAQNLIDNDKKTLKDILFEINKNYNNEINFPEFIDIITLKFTRTLKKKLSLRIKKESRKSVLDMAKSQVLSDTKKETNTEENNTESGKLHNNITEQRYNNESKDKKEGEETKNKIMQNINSVEINKNIKEQNADSTSNRENQINEELYEKTVHSINNAFTKSTYFEKLIQDKI
jgi:hypothetical protein